MSRQTPLLSNLSITENIALILQVHEKLSREDALQQAKEALESLDLGYLCEFRYNNCNLKETFHIQLIRAIMIKGSQIIIDQPFSLVREELSLDFIFKALEKLKISINTVLILDLNHQKNYYKESPCLIIK
ncbi:hypothetical protein JHD50_12905 [Sulfurimonas sp. MAG313]|nr:hypothetical protein [Sulfurimonas sp. MAG313]MDF1882187.1 hypothetical protein [Sulfurimonas sp. MAG313]